MRSSVSTLDGLDAIELRHLDIHNHQIGAQLARQVDHADAIASLPNYQIPKPDQSFLEIHTDDRLVVSDHQA